MNFKYKVLGFVAAIGMSIGLAGPALADKTADSANVSVKLTEDGAFAVNIESNVALLPKGVSAISTGVVTTGQIAIFYTDTKSYRNGFTTDLGADDLESQSLTQPLVGGPYTIAASNLTVTRDYNPAQGRWTSVSPFRIGDIGTVDSGTFTHPAGEFCNTGSGALDSGNVGFFAWTAPGNSLDTNRTIACADPGPGTAGTHGPALVTGTDLSTGTEQLLDVSLAVPDGQPADRYKATLTVTVTFANP
jgi:hypothetical protein